MIEGVNEEFLRNIVSQIRERAINSFEDFQRTVGILCAYDQISDPTEELANDFIKNNQGISHSNLSTKQILEDVKKGKDISSLMEVNNIKVGGRQNYDWETRHSDHADTLDRLREFGNSMYRQTDILFNLTSEHEQMRGVARNCYDKSQDLFQFWESVIKINQDDIVTSAPLELAQEIFAYVKNKDSRLNISQGLKSIKYIDQQNPQQEVDKVVRWFGSYFVNNIPTDTTRATRLRKTLLEATAYLGPPV